MLHRNLGPPASRILDLVHREDRLEPLDAVRKPEEWDQIEGAVPYDRCLLWSRHRRYYADRGRAAWTSGEVPSLGTGNPGVVRQHAGLVYRALVRLQEAGRLGPVLPILELGSGLGIFAFNFLRALLDLDREHATDFYPRTRFLVSDSSPKVLDDARSHPLLRDLAAEGRLDFLPLDALDSGPLTAAAPEGLVALVANYVHCCLPLTLVRRGAQGELLEKMVRLHVPGSAAERSIGPAGRIAETVSWRPLEPDERFPAEDRERLLLTLDERQDEVVEAPYGSFRHLRSYLPRLVPGGLMLICDRPVDPDAPAATRFSPTFHGSSLAHPVDLRLLAGLGGELGHATALTPAVDGPLQTLMIERPGAGRPATLEDTFHRCFRAGASTADPSRVMRAAVRLQAGRQVEASFRWLRDACSRYPDDAFLRYLYGTFLDRRGHFDEALAVLREGRDADPFGVLDFEFKIGHVHHRSQRPRQALAAYRQSLGRTPRAVTWYNAGLCHEEMDEFADAAAAYLQAAELDPALEPARRAAALCKVAARHAG